MDTNKMKSQVADVLQDFAAILVEEVAFYCDIHCKNEAAIMERLNRVIKAFREGDTSVENVYEHRDGSNG